MKTFKEYLTEAKEVENKLLHLQHLEDLHVDNDASGFHHAVATLKHAKEHVESEHENKDITQKMDGCIHGDSLVVTKNGAKKISELTNTDEVKCFDTDTGVYSFYKNTTPIHGSGVKKFIKLTFDNGSEFVCTEDHPILISERNGYEYVDAKDTLGLLLAQIK